MPSPGTSSKSRLRFGSRVLARKHSGRRSVEKRIGAASVAQTGAAYLLWREVINAAETLWRISSSGERKFNAGCARQDRRGDLESADSISLIEWSGRADLNRGPLAPKASALPDCATPRRNSPAEVEIAGGQASFCQGSAWQSSRSLVGAHYVGSFCPKQRGRKVDGLAALI
jgi:hypothetical protein